MAIRVEENMDEEIAQEGGEKNARGNGNIGALVKKYRDASRLLLPRAIFMMMVFAAIVIFMSSLFMGAGISVWRRSRLPEIFLRRFFFSRWNCFLFSARSSFTTDFF